MSMKLSQNAPCLYGGRYPAWVRSGNSEKSCGKPVRNGTGPNTDVENEFVGSGVKGTYLLN